MTRTTGLSFLPHVAAAFVVMAVVMAGLSSQTGTAAADPDDATAESNVYLIQDNFQVIAGNQETEDNSSQTAYNLFSGSQDNTAASGDAAGYATARSFAIVIQTNVQVIAGWNCGVDQTAANVASLDQNATAFDGSGYGYAMALNLAVIMQTNTQIYVCTGLDGGGGEQTAVNSAGVDQSADAATGGGSAGAEEAGTGAIAGTGEAATNWGAAAGSEHNAEEGSGAEASETATWDTSTRAAETDEGATPGAWETGHWAAIAQALETAWSDASVFNIALLNQDNFQLAIDR